MRISVFASTQNENVERPFQHANRSDVRRWLLGRSPIAYVLDGKSADNTLAIKLIGVPEPVARKSCWRGGRMEACVLNRGRSGQFSLGYPVPPVFKGHISMPMAMQVNAIPKENL